MNANRMLVLAAVVVLLLTGCSDASESETGQPQERQTTTSLTVPAPVHPAQPERLPDVTGQVGAGSSGLNAVLVGASDPSYEGMPLGESDDVAIFDAETAEELTMHALTPGARIVVWLGGECAETSPVLCALAAIGVNRGR
tara:strand:+ start:164 stop:586 length:423 start_codon:yes stop_codon:yes gene_type:complete